MGRGGLIASLGSVRFIAGALKPWAMIRFPALAAMAAFALAAPVLAAAAPAGSAPATQPRFTIEQQTAVRCSAAFAVVAAIQQQGGGTQYPPLAERGREFFVRTAARLMDDTGMDHGQVAQALQGEAQALVADPGKLAAVMPACLVLLDSSGI